ncbi:HutD family protein [Rhodococcus sp. Eu-32]|uniref:HutD/Ves family protein n=1 Tax=Rhodococcus sp. Eu-32 TaxID=1017319 RepID=UPI00140343CC|nr:HutD family protein [Rhodococcus sp. Eu-32]
MPPPVTLIRDEDRTRVPWKNGAGITAELAADDSWRVSVADLGEAPSLFSAFAGRARIFTVVGDHGVTFDVDGSQSQIAPLTPYAFDGALTPTCIPDGPTSALNIMVDDVTSTAAVQVVVLQESSFTTAPDSVTAIYLHSGRARSGHTDICPGDCLLVREDSIEITGTATILVAEIRKSPHRTHATTA